MAAISAIVGVYLVATFTSTGLAKLLRHRGAAAGLTAEAVIPKGIAHATVLCISALELALAAFFIATIQTLVTGLLAAILFLAFGLYRTLSAIKTGHISCSCTGTVRKRMVGISDISGALFASVAQAAIACVWAFSPTPEVGAIKVLLGLAAMIPVAAYCLGIISKRRTVSRSRMQQGADVGMI